jgi:hypothetical protein
VEPEQEPEPQETKLFALEEPGSGRSVSGSAFEYRSDGMTKVKKSKKIKNQITFWATVLLITLKSQDFVQNFLFEELYYY